MRILDKYIKKYLWHMHKVHYRKRTLVLPYPPREYWIEPTSYCNLKCPMCPQGMGLVKDKGYMSMDLYRRLIGMIRPLRPQRINLFLGGEALLHKDVIEMFRVAKQAGIPLRLHTNALVMKEKIMDAILDTPLEEISFSFDGEDKQTYERMRAGGNYDKAVGLIKTFLAKKKARGARLPYTRIQVIKTPDPATGRVEATEQFKGIFEGLPVDRFNAIRIHSYGGRIKDGEVKGQAYRRLHGSYTPCSQQWRALSITWDGLVVGCCIDLERRMVLGDLKVQTVMEVWNGGKMVEHRRRFAERRLDEMPMCADCDQLREG